MEKKTLTLLDGRNLSELSYSTTFDDSEDDTFSLYFKFDKLPFELRFDIHPEYLIMHLKILKMVRDIEKDVLTVYRPLALYLMDKYNYNEIHFVSSSWKIFRVFGHNKFEFVGTQDDYMIYKLSKENLLCLG